MLLKMFSSMNRQIVPYVLVIIVCHCSQTFSKGTFSVIDNIDENGNIIMNDKYSSFDFGQEFFVDEILQEIEDMGLRPRRINQPFKRQSGETCLDSCSSSDSSLSKVTKNGNNDDYFQPITRVEQTTMQNRVKILDDSTFKNSVYDISKESTESNNDKDTGSTSDVIEKIQAGNIDEILASLKKIVEFSGVSLDYSEDGGEDNNIVHGVQKRSTDGKESSLVKMNSREDEAMAESVSDILGPVKGERQARLFYNFDRGSAFNTSVAFTIPLFSFTMPDAGDVATDGLFGNVFGTMTFVSLFILGGLGVAIYTTTQGKLGPNAARSFNADFPGAQLLLGKTDESLAEAVNTILIGLSEALDLPSCSQLAACEAHLRPKEYSVVGLPFRVMAPLKPEVPQEDLSPLEAAGRVGAEGGDCAWEFPCIVDPLELMELVLDLLAGKFS